MTRKPGLSGIIRAKNEGRFIAACIDSVIGSLDELIVVYNDCTDDTETILTEKAQQYPDKIRIFPYNHHVLYNNLTPEEFQYAVALPEDSDRLHSSQCNYGLSQTTFTHAMKIDPDQVYIADEVKRWRNICAADIRRERSVKDIFGWLFMNYFSMYRRLSALCRRPLTFMLPGRMLRLLKQSYMHYIEYRLQHGTIAVSLSGINLYYDNCWCIPFDRFNTHPPYNGEGDHLIFKICPTTCYKKLYNMSQPTKVIEEFHHPYRVVVSPNPVWFHLHALRPSIHPRVLEVKLKYPHLFARPADLIRMSYGTVTRLMGNRPDRLFQRILFVLIHRMGMDATEKYIATIGSISPAGHQEQWGGKNPAKQQA